MGSDKGEQVVPHSKSGIPGMRGVEHIAKRPKRLFRPK